MLSFSQNKHIRFLLLFFTNIKIHKHLKIAWQDILGKFISKFIFKIIFKTAKKGSGKKIYIKNCIIISFYWNENSADNVFFNRNSTCRTVFELKLWFKILMVKQVTLINNTQVTLEHPFACLSKNRYPRKKDI